MLATESRRLWAFFARDMQMALSYPIDFLLRMGMILFQVFLIYFLSLLVGEKPELAHQGGYLPFVIVGMATLSFFQSGFSSFPQALRREQVTGTLEAVLMTPTRIPSFLIGSAIWDYSWATFTALIYLTAASALYDVQLKGSILLAIALLILLTLFFASLGIMSAAIVMVFKRGDPLAVFVGTFSALLGGAFFPVSLLPDWLEKVSLLIPLRHGLDGLRAVLLEGMTLAEIWRQFLALAAFDIVLLPLSFFVFNRALARARREGTLLQY